MLTRIPIVTPTTTPARTNQVRLRSYERYGFEQTGEIVFDNEILLQYELR
jgi:hypothetical protein